MCTNTGEAIAALGDMRRAVRATGVGLLGAGTHPGALEGSAEITDQDRYERIRDLLGDAAVTPVAGLHVHIGMPDAETAVRTFNGLREQLPLLNALAANSPFRHGRDTGLASAREVTLRSWPRSGVPRALRDFAEFEQLADLLCRAAGVDGLHLVLVEAATPSATGHGRGARARRPDDAEDTAALVALTHCLARHAAELRGRPGEPSGAARGRALPRSSVRHGRGAARRRRPAAQGR